MINYKSFPLGSPWKHRTFLHFWFFSNSPLFWHLMMLCLQGLCTPAGACQCHGQGHWPLFIGLFTKHPPWARPCSRQEKQRKVNHKQTEIHQQVSLQHAEGDSAMEGRYRVDRREAKWPGQAAGRRRWLCPCLEKITKDALKGQFYFRLLSYFWVTVCCSVAMETPKPWILFY